MQQLLRGLAVAVVIFAGLYALTARTVPSQPHTPGVDSAPPHTGSAGASDSRRILQRSEHSGSPTSAQLSSPLLLRWWVGDQALPEERSWETGARHSTWPHHVRGLRQGGTGGGYQEAGSGLISAVQQPRRTSDEV